MPAEERVVRRPGGSLGWDFEVFFRANYPPLVRLLSAAADDVEDAVQEAFVQAHLQWSKISRYDDPVAWIRLVAVRRLLNRERLRSRRRRALERLRPSTDAPMGGPGPTSTLDLADAVRRLPARQRLIVALFYVCDLPLSEIASATGTSVGTVKASLFAARKTLRIQLENYGDV
jgi:RNA polymerase sigma-70 factor, ECF subfamily